MPPFSFAYVVLFDQKRLCPCTAHPVCSYTNSNPCGNTSGRAVQFVTPPPLGPSGSLKYHQLSASQYLYGMPSALA